MPKYWRGDYFAHGRFPEVGQKQKTEKKRKEEKDPKLVITMAKLRMVHARTQAAWANNILSKALKITKYHQHNKKL